MTVTLQQVEAGHRRNGLRLRRLQRIEQERARLRAEGRDLDVSVIPDPPQSEEHLEHALLVAAAEWEYQQLAAQGAAPQFAHQAQPLGPAAFPTPVSGMRTSGMGPATQAEELAALSDRQAIRAAVQAGPAAAEAHRARLHGLLGRGQPAPLRHSTAGYTVTRAADRARVGLISQEDRQAALQRVRSAQPRTQVTFHSPPAGQRGLGAYRPRTITAPSTIVQPTGHARGPLTEGEVRKIRESRAAKRAVQALKNGR